MTPGAAKLQVPEGIGDVTDLSGTSWIGTVIARWHFINLLAQAGADFVLRTSPSTTVARPAGGVNMHRARAHLW